MDFLILGSTSNICISRVYDNLNDIHEKINNIYCYDMVKHTNNSFLNYIKTNIDFNYTFKLQHKINYLYGLFDLEHYEKIIKPLIHKKLIIYVAVPPFCYETIISFFSNYKNTYKYLILEKPLSLDYNNYKLLKQQLFENTYVMDHFLYKSDIQNIIKKHKHDKITFFKISFHYDCDVENRLRYFDNVGFFIDMFQSHYLSILYSLIGPKINDLIDALIVKNIKKQYYDYGGKNKVDTYFQVQLEDLNVEDKDGCNYVFEGGKAMKEEKKIIQINNHIYEINNYYNEYRLFFTDLIKNNANNLISQHDLFWKITEKINNNFKVNDLKLSYYYKNKL
jgi:glucose-6-phosphate 1-dehydrogenase